MGESPVRRRLARAARGVRWAWKTARGVPREIRVDLRWRLGDEIMALPVYAALRERYPDCRVCVVCNYPDLLIDNPYAVAADPGSVADRVINLRSGPRKIYRLEHYARLAGVPTPTERPRLFYADWHTPLLNQLHGKYVAVAAGASWATKRWPAEHWRAVFSVIQDLGYLVVKLGNEGEQTGAGISFAGRTSIRDAACVLHSARLLVACDSGLMHLALAAGTPVLALFGPTDPDILIRNEPLFHPIRSNVECQGCWNRCREDFPPGTCPQSHDPANAPCMQSISVDQVLAALRDLL